MKEQYPRYLNPRVRMESLNPPERKEPADRQQPAAQNDKRDQVEGRNGDGI